MASLDTALIQAAADAAMITYDTVEKTLVIPEALKTVGVKGDKNSRLITFSLPVKPDLVDLSASTTSLIMDFTNASGQTGQYPIADKQTTDGRVIFSVAMPASMCTEKGTVSVGIRAYDSDERCWLTGYGTMELQDALDVSDITAEDPRYTLLEQVMARLGMSEDDMSGFLKKSEADATYYKKTEPIVLTDEQKLELKGQDGGYYVPHLDSSGNLTFTGSESGMPTATSGNVKGGFYTPSVDEAGNITFTPSDSDMPAVEGANIMGPSGGPEYVYYETSPSVLGPNQIADLGTKSGEWSYSLSDNWANGDICHIVFKVGDSGSIRRM